jgi:hypothetical protein
LVGLLAASRVVLSGRSSVERTASTLPLNQQVSPEPPPIRFFVSFAPLIMPANVG